MIGRWVAVGLCSSLALVLAGCAGAASEPPEPRVEPAVAAVAPPVSEPEAPPVEAVEPSPTIVEPNSIALAPVAPQRAAEPNLPPTTEPAEPNEPNSLPPVPAPEPEAVAVEPEMPAPDEVEAVLETEPDVPVVPPVVEANEPAPEPPVLPGAEELEAFYNRYAELLQENVRNDGRVDYARLRRQRPTLRELLNYPDNLDPNAYAQWPEEMKLSFWINVYNLKMVDIIVRNHPIQSSWWLRLTWPPSDIRHIDGIWSDYHFIVMDEEFTLEAVERRVFSRTFGDPRVFLAIHYAARSGPPLRSSPYRAADLDEQLDDQVRKFLADARVLRIDRGRRRVYLSALFKPTWRGGEFVARYGTDRKFKSHPAETRAVLNFLTQYLSPEDVRYLEVENYALEYVNFDWRLSDASRPR